jgi:hypothetical protein
MALNDAAPTTPDTAGRGRPVGIGCPDCSGGMFEFLTGQAVH